MLLQRAFRQALNAQVRYAIYDASGRYEMGEEPLTLDDVQVRFDELLDAEPTVESSDRELLELMGVAGA